MYFIISALDTPVASKMKTCLYGVYNDKCSNINMLRCFHIVLHVYIKFISEINMIILHFQFNFV